jgi:hypothetical protein
LASIQLGVCPTVYELVAYSDAETSDSTKAYNTVTADNATDRSDSMTKDGSDSMTKDRAESKKSESKKSESKKSEEKNADDSDQSGASITKASSIRSVMITGKEPKVTLKTPTDSQDSNGATASDGDSGAGNSSSSGHSSNRHERSSAPTDGGVQPSALVTVKQTFKMSEIMGDWYELARNANGFQSDVRREYDIITC